MAGLMTVLKPRFWADGAILLELVADGDAPAAQDTLGGVPGDGGRNIDKSL
jgi:hypothetical protein